MRRPAAWRLARRPVGGLAAGTGLLAFLSALAVAGPPPRVVVEFFFSAGCEECAVVRDEVLAPLRRQYGEQVEWRAYDTGDATNFLHLVRLQERLGVRENETVSVFVNGRIHLGGAEDIRGLLPGTLAALLGGPAATGTVAMAAAPAAAPGESSTVLEDRFRRFTLGTVVTAGLVDGFNPCAFATIVFFVSLLTVSGVRGSRVLLVGLSFGAAVFATYLALGFGVFRLLSALTAWRAAAGVLNAVMVAALAVLALLSFRDAWRFGRSGRPADVVLQLPDRIKRRIHAIMRERLSLRHLVPSTALIGVLVTLLESVCTGQVYVPTLVFLTTHPELGRRAWTLLVIYNVMFVVPLAVVTAAACYGTRSQRLMEWSRRNVVRSKVLLGLFFAGLAVVLLVF